MTDKPKVSIIIPVYNVSKYLEECLDSVINQTLKDIEIILINDKSPDPLDDKICKRYAKKDNRIIYVQHRKNKGLGGVRNTGIKMANGEYQWHIDSDDLIDTQACEFLYNTAKEKSTEILTFSGCNFYVKKGKTYYDSYFSRNKNLCNKVISGKDFLVMARKENVFHCAIWLNFFKSDFLKNFSKHYQFVENKLFQDTDYTPILYTKTNKVLCIHYTPYFRRVHNESTTYSEITPAKVSEKFEVSERLLDYIEKEELPTDHPLTAFLITDFEFFKKRYKDQIENGGNNLKRKIKEIDSRIQLIDLPQNISIVKQENFPDYEYIADLTIMIKTFLRPDMLKRILNSIGNYQEKNKVIFKSIIIGDDSTSEILKEDQEIIKQCKSNYPHLSITYKKYEFNIGCAEGRNRMIKKIETTYFLYCDDDYIFDPDCNINKALSLIKKEKLDILGGWVNNIQSNNINNPYTLNGKFQKFGSKIVCNIKTDDFPDLEYYDYLINFYIGRTSKIREVLWDPELKTEEHLDFFWRAYKKDLKMAFTKELFITHHHVSNSKYEKFRSIKHDGEKYLYLRVQKSGAEELITNYFSAKNIKTWIINSTKKENKIIQHILKKPLFNQLVPIKRISPPNEHNFFGYFDLEAQKQNEYLSLSVPYIHKFPEKNDIAKIRIIKNGKAYDVDETKAWNFQQGCFLQYRPGYNNEIVYNIFDEDSKKYKAVIYNTKTKKKKIISHPIANISSDGNTALSVNFSRLYDYRPGYGYSNIPDPYYFEKHPKKDGVFKIDLNKNTSKLIISYDELSKILTKGSKLEDEKILINHINFSPDGKKIVMLVRWFSDQAPWPTMTVVADSTGKNIRKVFGFTSHYNWKDNKTLMISGSEGIEKNNSNKITVYELDINTCVYKKIDENFFIGDGHCSYSPNKRYILYDSYPSVQFPYRKLHIYDLINKKGKTLAYFYSDPLLYNKIGDCRCDLHPRWSSDGKFITLDSMHEGYRAIYEIKVDDAINTINKDFSVLTENEIKSLINPPKLTQHPKISNNKWVKFGSYSKKRKIWELGKMTTKELHLYSFLKYPAKLVKNSYKLLNKLTHEKIQKKNKQN
jgi:glycosyltransferase involved in cell wall biosynthesis